MRQEGTNCQLAFTRYETFKNGSVVLEYDWALRDGTAAWIVLTLAALSILRLTPLRGSRVKGLIPAVCAMTPPILFGVQECYHPRDLWALATVFFAVSLELREHSD